MLAIAQAMAARPSVLLLDEPLAGLAPDVACQVLQSIRRLADGGMAVVIVEPRGHGALTIADQDVVLDGGRIGDGGRPSTFERELQAADASVGRS